MQRHNQSAATECCSGEGQVGAPLEGASGRTTHEKRTQGTWRAASGGRTPLKQFSAETHINADGEGVLTLAPGTDEAASGEASKGLPASQSVESSGENMRKLGKPCGFRAF